MHELLKERDFVSILFVSVWINDANGKDMQWNEKIEKIAAHNYHEFVVFHELYFQGREILRKSGFIAGWIFVLMLYDEFILSQLFQLICCL